MRQVTGPTMMLRICALSPEKGYTHFFYGGNDGVAEQLKQSLTARFSWSQCRGHLHASVPSVDCGKKKRTWLGKYRKPKPDFFWVGLSTPKQERFMDQYISKLDAQRSCWALEAAFDIHTGRIKDAPYWMKLTGVQWMHRIYQDPKRLWKRYLVNNPSLCTGSPWSCWESPKQQGSLSRH